MLCLTFQDILLLMSTHILKFFVVQLLLKYLEHFRDMGVAVSRYESESRKSPRYTQGPKEGGNWGCCL